MISIHTLMFLFFLINTAASCVIFYLCSTTFYNRARYGTDTRPKQTRNTQAQAQHNTVFLRAWRDARQNEEETVPGHSHTQ